jgi:hypothetical protein
MMLTDRYQALWERMHALREAWLELRITVREDVPVGDGAMPAERLGDHLDDALGTLEDALATASTLVQDETRPRDVTPGLAHVGERLAAASRIYARDVGAYAPQAELGALARRRGPQWAAWLTGVREAAAPIPDLDEATQAAWRAAVLELVDRATGPGDDRITMPGDTASLGHEAEGHPA